jgi:hypothetical protein
MNEENPNDRTTRQPPASAGLASASGIARLAGPVLIAIATLFMLAWSWETWSDPLVDFGAQLYVPWQISTGHVLYRDLAYYNGPLSSYVNATAFRLFGVGLHTLVWVNLLILALVMTLAYRLTVASCGRWAATVAGLTFALVFAFGQVVRIGNYNWVTPYTHEITHGVALGLAAIVCTLRYQRTLRARWIAATGGLLGCVFLTKAEPTAASFAAVAVLLAGGWWFARTHPRQILSVLAILMGFTLIAPLIAWLLLATAMPSSEALRGVLGSWPWVFDSRITSLHFYRDVSGLDDIRGNLGIVLDWCDIYTVLIGAGIGLLCRSRRSRLSASITVFAVCSGIFAWQFGRTNWSGILTPLPVCLALVLVACGIAVVRRISPLAPVRLGLVVFACVLVAKMGLKAYAYHYGFVLAWPATVVLVCVVAQHLPDWIRRHGGSALPLRMIGLAAWLFAVAAMLRKDAQYFAHATTVVAAGTVDEFRGDGRAAGVAELCARISQLVPPDGTVVVLPQGLMVNYLTRRVSPTKYINFMPPEVLAAGEQNILAAFQRNPPDAVVLTPAVIEDRHFTLDDRDPYGADTLRWVMQNYEPAEAEEMHRPLVIMLPKR